jgi:DNA-binding CsgD family transcriptional regulator
MFVKYDQIKLQNLYDSGKTDEEMAEAMGISRQSVQEWRHRNYLKTNNVLRTVIDEDLAFQLWSEGKVDKEIAETLNVGNAIVQRWRNERDLPSNQGVFSWQKKIMPSEFAKIPEKYRDPKLCIA